MKILIDTNVLISAALFPGSVSALAVESVMKNPCEVILCDYVLKEMRDGDRDFTAVVMERPLILTPGEYLRMIL